jgi:inhibitor of cysteine peptidase
MWAYFIKWMMISAVLANMAFINPGNSASAPVQLPSSAADPTEITWSLEMDVPASPEQIQSGEDIELARSQLTAELDSRLADNSAVTFDVANPDGGFFPVTLNGSGNQDDLRSFLFSLGMGFDFLDGPIDIDIQSQAISNQEFPVVLESRPSTGFSWLLTGSDGALIEEERAITYQNRTQSAGTSAVATLHLKSSSTGTTNLHLSYRRPWETQAASRRLTLKYGSLTYGVNLTNPFLTLFSLLNGSAAVGPFKADLPVSPASGLPSSFDWRSLNMLTPIRDQGGCGSCWAFGTTAVLESAILRSGGGSQDLSEQYLVSCNTSGYSCDGGWWAHSYHFNLKGAQQTVAGAVMESSFPYTQSNASCTQSYNHPYRISNWQYVDYFVDIPSVEQLKTAIYQHGPVSVGICVGNNFQYYAKGTILTTSDSCGFYKINHAVALVGWDDAGQYWILRNSWGTDWGDNGYMRIKWGTSNVGFGATYIEYSAPPDVPTAISPSGTLANSRPTFSWSVSPIATNYRVKIVQSGSTIASMDLQTSTACSGSTCSVPSAISLSNGSYNWSVQAYNTAGSSAWSNSPDFLIFAPTLTPTPTSIPTQGSSSTATPEPGELNQTPTPVGPYPAPNPYPTPILDGTVPIPTSPTGTISNQQPTFTWAPVSNAVSYTITITGPGITYTFTIPASTACTAESCTFMPEVPLPAGTYTWIITATLPGGVVTPGNTSTFAITPGIFLPFVSR